MARVDYEGAPTQESRVEAPDDYEHIEANPASFGAAAAAGLEAAGQGGLDAAKFYGTVAADNSTNNTLEQVNKILHGDPSKNGVGPDGQPTGDTGYYGLRGADAMAARPQVAQEIDSIIAQNREHLSTPQSIQDYENQTRRYRAQWLNEIGSHADQQQKVWSQDTNNTTAQLALNDFSRKAADPDAFDQATQTVRKAYVRNAQLAGEDPAGALLKADQAVAETQVRSLLLSDPPAAQAAMKQHQDVLGGTPQAYTLSREVQARNEDYLTGIYSDPRTVAETKAAAPVPGSVQAGAPHPNNIGNVKGAGGGFASPATPQDGVTLAANTLREGYRGLTLAQIAEKWAPASDHNDPAAWAATVSQNSGIKTTDVPDLNDPKTLQSLVSGIGVAEKKTGDLAAFTPDTVSKGVAASLAGQHAKLAPAAEGAAADGGDAYLAYVRQRVREQLGPDNPNGVEQVVQRVKFNLQRDDNAQSAQVQESVKDAITYLNDGGDPTKLNMTPDSIRTTIPGKKGEDMAGDLAGAIDYAQSVRQIATASPEEVQSILQGHAPEGPEDYRTNATRFQALQKAAQERVAAIYGTATKPGDPAGYVNTFMPDVAAAFTKALSGKDPAAFDAYVTKLNGAYGALGVPDNLRSTLPRQVASSIISTVQTAQPQQAVSYLQALQKDTGKWWPAMYRDLVRAGLPSTFQAPLVVASTSPKDAQIMVAALQRDADARTNNKKPMEEEASGLTFNNQSVSAVVKKAVSTDTGMLSLRASFGVAGRSGVDSFAGVQSAVESTALYLYLSGSVRDPSAAAVRAAAMVTGPYDFIQQGGHPPARLPKGSASDFRDAAAATLGALKAGDIRSYAVETNEAGEPIAVTPEERAAHALQGAKNSYWVTVPGSDGRGAVRAIDPATGAPVTKANGAPLDIPFANMKLIAARNRQQMQADIEQAAAQSPNP